MQTTTHSCLLRSLLSCIAAALVSLAAWTVAAQEINGTSTIGPRASHIFTLRIPADPNDPNDFGDTLPPGPGIFYQYGIYDTGANTIGINNIPTSDGNSVFQSTANFLDLCGPGDFDCPNPSGNPPSVAGLPITDLRLWGLGAIDMTTGGAPLDTPQAEILGILTRPSPIVRNLIGAPAANNTIAYIDFTTIVDHNEILFPGADITFYPGGGAGYPAPLYELQLARFGLTTPTIEGATRGSLYSLVDFAFENNGSSVSTGDMLTLPDATTRAARVFFDTGTTTTQVTEIAAMALGIDLANDPVDDTVTVGLAGGQTQTLNCYAITRVEFPGVNGAYSYAIASPLVCVSPTPFFANSADPHDIILGTNYFEQTQILVDGPGDRVGMYQGVANNNAPTADAGPDQVVECDSSQGTSVMLNGSGSSDPDGDMLTYTWTGSFGTATGATPTVTLSTGVHEITLQVDDGNGGTSTDTVQVEVVDTTAPELALTVSPTVMWPPNHNLIPIDVTALATDICDADPSVELILIESSEGDLADTYDPAIDTTEVVGRKGGDIQIVDGQLYLRAERSGNSDGRIYTIHYRATDASGNSTTETATVTVPHNQ